jgi:hypothetical protein
MSDVPHVQVAPPVMKRKAMVALCGNGVGPLRFLEHYIGKQVRRPILYYY